MGLRRGQKPVADLVDISTLQAMRNVDFCACCGRLGDRRRMVRAVLLNDFQKFDRGQYLHGRCAIKIAGIEALKLLPRKEVFGLTISDIGIEWMKQLIARKPALDPRKPPKRVQ